MSFSYAPDFSAKRYGYYKTYQKTDADGNVTLVEYSPYQGSLYGVPGKGKTGSISFDVSNNVEMKIRETRTTRSGFKKISLIDEFGASMSYNMAAKVRPWSDLSTRIRLKLTKSYTFNLNAVFASYIYEADSVGATPRISEHTTYWEKGKIGRFQGMSQNLSYTLDNTKVANFFKWLRGEKVEKKNDKGNEDDDEFGDEENENETNIDREMEKGKHGASRKGCRQGRDRRRRLHGLLAAVVAQLRLWYHHARGQRPHEVQLQHHALSLQVHAEPEHQRQHTHQRRMEHLVLQRLRLREQEDIDDHGLAVARPPLLQHVVLGGAGALHQL